MSSALNTHTYDGNLAHELLHHPLLTLVHNWTREQKFKCGLELLLLIRTQSKPNRSLRFLKGIISSIGTSANIDTSNNLIADDLLCLAWLLRNEESFLSELQVQLIDMATGFCPQGRTHRLFQVILAFIKQLDELKVVSPPEL